MSGTLLFMQSVDLEPHRGRWIAVALPEEDHVVAHAGSLGDLNDALDALGQPRVLVWRVPAADEPLFIGVG